MDEKKKDFITLENATEMLIGGTPIYKISLKPVRNEEKKDTLMEILRE